MEHPFTTWMRTGGIPILGNDHLIHWWVDFCNIWCVCELWSLNVMTLFFIVRESILPPAINHGDGKSSIDTWFAHQNLHLQWISCLATSVPLQKDFVSARIRRNKESAPLLMGYSMLPPKKSCRIIIYHYFTRILPSYLWELHINGRTPLLQCRHVH